MTNSTEVVLATYNGEAFLENQLLSLLQQDMKADIIVHDDGSKDDTIEIIKKYEKQGLLRKLSGASQGGACANFAYLLQKSEADYVLCSDQDDIWEIDKIDKLLHLIKFYESVYGKDYPLLIHSDLSLIDEYSNTIAESFWEYQKLQPEWGDSFPKLLTQNVVTGCTVMVNRALLRKALPIPTEATMHDHWLALVACAFGKVVWIPDKLVKYRQHSQNELGAKKMDLWIKLANNNIKHLISEMDDSLEKHISQARTFAIRFPDTKYTQMAYDFSNIKSVHSLSRLKYARDRRFLKSSRERQIAWSIFLTIGDTLCKKA